MICLGTGLPVQRRLLEEKLRHRAVHRARLRLGPYALSEPAKHISTWQ